jgi:hypothetical protein
MMDRCLFFVRSLPRRKLEHDPFILSEAARKILSQQLEEHGGETENGRALGVP